MVTMIEFRNLCSLLKWVPLILSVGVMVVIAEENCHWKPDGSQVCEDEELHNVWTRDTSEAYPESISSLIKPLSTDKLETELVVHYFETSDRDLDESEVNSILALDGIQVVQRVIQKFGTLDLDNDGKISQKELQETLGDKVDEDSVDQLAPSGISILQYVNLMSRINENSDVVLTTFKSLDFLSSYEIRKVIEGSVRMFLEIDADSNGGLDLEEYLVSLEKDRKKSKMTEVMSAEQKKAIFDMIDKDQSKDISYFEFQTVLPQKPKDVTGNLQEVFKRADLNSDGFLDTEEFEAHLKDMSVKMKRPTEPSESEIDEAFEKLDKDGDGMISSEEMNGVLGEIEKLTEAKSTQAFKEMDTDGDGVLSKSEIDIVAQVMEQRSGGEKFDADVLLKMLDRNSDGVIQFEEMNELVKRMMPQPKKS